MSARLFLVSSLTLLAACASESSEQAAYCKSLSADAFALAAQTGECSLDDFATAAGDDSDPSPPDQDKERDHGGADDRDRQKSRDLPDAPQAAPSGNEGEADPDPEPAPEGGDEGCDGCL